MRERLSHGLEISSLDLVPQNVFDQGLESSLGKPVSPLGIEVSFLLLLVTSTDQAMFCHLLEHFSAEGVAVQLCPVHGGRPLLSFRQFRLVPEVELPLGLDAGTLEDSLSLIEFPGLVLQDLGQVLVLREVGHVLDDPVHLLALFQPGRHDYINNTVVIAYHFSPSSSISAPSIA